MLNIHAWDSRFRRLTVGSDVVRFRWFDTLDPALPVATTGRDVQVDLLVGTVRHGTLGSRVGDDARPGAGVLGSRRRPDAA